MIEIGTAASADEWDTFVRASPDSTFCHLWGWRDIMSEVLGHEYTGRVATGPDGATLGLLPLVGVRTGLFGDQLLSMPFLNYGGPIGADAATDALVEDAVATARDDGFDFLEVRSRGRRPGPPTVDSDRKVTVVLDLPEDAADLWENGLRAKVRSQVRRPQKEGMVTRFGRDQLEPFYRVFQENMRDLGTPVLPRELFHAMYDAFEENVEVACVYHKGTPVAAGYGFAWRDEFEITWASSLRAYNRLAPNMLLYWAFLERCIDRGLEAFNFGRCTPDGGTHRFKLQWGGRDEPLPWGEWRRKPGASAASPDRPHLKLATRVWSRLPLAVANRLGPVIARRLP